MTVLFKIVFLFLLCVNTYSQNYVQAVHLSWFEIKLEIRNKLHNIIVTE